MLGLASVFSVHNAVAQEAPLVLEGSGEVAGENIQHPNGNIFDQVLLTGQSIKLQAKPGQITRVSFMDEDEDIVQVEFSGSGAFTVSLDPDTFLPSALPPRYNQDVMYVTGKPTVVIEGADASTFFSIFTVGTINAVNQALFPEGQVYDAEADVTLVEVLNSTGFGGMQLSNVVFSGSIGKTGVDARGVPIAVRLTVGDIDADGDAVPHLLFGSGSFTVPAGNTGLRITGGDLTQTNEASVVVAESGSTTPGFDTLISQNNFKSDHTPQPTLSINATFTNEEGDEITVAVEELTIDQTPPIDLGLAPENEAAFNDLVVGQRILSGLPNYFVDFVAAGRFEETEGAATYTGSYAYSNTGPDTGTVVFNYDDGDQCTSNLTFVSATAGTSTYTCNDGERGEDSWQLATVSPPLPPPIDLGLAPENEATFNDLVVGQRILSGLPNYYVDFVAAGRFEETEGAVTYTGSYAYSNTGPDTGTVVFNYDDGDQCTSNLTFVSATAGTSTYTCNYGERGEYSWQLATVSPPLQVQDYTPLEGLRVSDGRVQFLFSSAGECIQLNSNINGVVYTTHTSKWQRRDGSSWVDIPGTEREGLCSYSPTSPGEYRLVAEISIGGERGRYSSENTLTVGG